MELSSQILYQVKEIAQKIGCLLCTRLSWVLSLAPRRMPFTARSSNSLAQLGVAQTQKTQNKPPLTVQIFIFNFWATYLWLRPIISSSAYRLFNEWRNILNIPFLFPFISLFLFVWYFVFTCCPNDTQGSFLCVWCWGLNPNLLHTSRLLTSCPIPPAGDIFFCKNKVWILRIIILFSSIGSVLSFIVGF